MPGASKGRSLKKIQKLVDEAAAAQGKRAQKAEEIAQGKAPTERPEPAPEPGGQKAFYLYKDAQGHEHLVDSLEMVPKKFRPGAKRWLMDAEEQDSGDVAGDIEALGESLLGTAPPASSSTRPNPEPSSTGLDLPSVLLGVAIGAALVMSSHLFKKNSSMVIRALVFALLVGVAGAAYFGWVRRQAGLADRGAATPASMLQDARQAAQTLEERNAAQLDLLDRIEEKPKPRFDLP